MPPVRNGSSLGGYIVDECRVSGAAALWEFYPCLLPCITFRWGSLSRPRHSLRKGSQVQDPSGTIPSEYRVRRSYVGNL